MYVSYARAGIALLLVLLLMSQVLLMYDSVLVNAQEEDAGIKFEIVGVDVQLVLESGWEASVNTTEIITRWSLEIFDSTFSMSIH